MPEKITKCVFAYHNKTLKLTRTGNPYLMTRAGNRYSCRNELNRKNMSLTNYIQPMKHHVWKKPTVPASKFSKGAVLSGYKVTMVRVPGGAGYRKAWRKQ